MPTELKIREARGLVYGGPGKKFDNGKRPFDLLPVVATEHVV